MERLAFLQSLSTYIGEPILATINKFTETSMIERMAMLAYHAEQDNSQYNLELLAFAEDSWYTLAIEVYQSSQIVQRRYSDISAVGINLGYNSFVHSSSHSYESALSPNSIFFDFGAHRYTVPDRVGDYNQGSGLRDLARYISSKMNE